MPGLKIVSALSVPATGALPFVPASVTASSKKPAAPSIRPAFAPASIKRSETPSDTHARNGAHPASSAAADADLASLIDSDAQPSKRARIESNFGAQLQAQMQAEREYGVSYAYDNRPKPQRAGKGRNKKHKDLEPVGSAVAYDVTQYTAPVSLAANGVPQVIQLLTHIF